MGVSYRASRAQAGAALGEQLEKIGEARNDAAAQLLGRSCKGLPASISGSSLPPAPSWSGVWALLIQRIAPSAGLSFDPYATMLAYLAVTLAYLGYIDQARSRMDEALSEARRLRHAHTLAHVLAYANWIDWLTGSPDGAHARNFWLYRPSTVFRFIWVGHWHSADGR